MIGDYQITGLYELIDFKVDFDKALDSIGRADWDTLTSIDFYDYKYYGRLQKVVIADILGITDYELEARGFYDIPRLRGMAYSRMAENLNRNLNE